MKRFLFPSGLAILLSVVLVSTSWAQVEVRVPYVTVRVGSPTVIQVPFVRLVFPGRACLGAPPRALPSLDNTLPPPRQVANPGDPPPVPIEEVPSRVVPPVKTAAPPASLPSPPSSPLPSAPLVTATLPVMTVKECASSFKALPSGGQYEVMLQHTFTGQPVKVAFSLPPGMPKKVTAGKLRLEFHYGKGRPVVVRFYRNGAVKVLRG